jgi:rRNA maturation RNase YbeY
MLDKNNISFFTKETSFDLENQNKIQEWIQQCVTSEDKSTGEISYVFCSDDYLHQINLQHLKHDTYTDIITFNYCENDIISGDIFISIDRVKENAVSFSTSFHTELHRVIIHGILHLLGYDDKTNQDKTTMRSKEDFYLTLLSV